MKKLNAKTVLSVCLASVMLTSLLSGCGDKTQTSSSNEKLDITWMMSTGTATPEEGTYPELLIEEKFNVNITPVFISGNYQEKKTMQIAGGQIPDLFDEKDPSNLFGDANQGALLELPYETIKKYAPKTFENINNTEPGAWLYSNFDGKNYGIPNFIYYNAYSRTGRIRMDWLKNVGINKVPETLDELHDALYKFTYEDPDGNGKKDTYGMSGDINTWDKMFNEIFGAYGILPFDWVKDGKNVVYGGLQQGTLDALETLAAWYKEGIIHPDFVTDLSMSTCKDKFTNGITGYISHVAYLNPAVATSVENLTSAIFPQADVQPVKTIIGPDGKRGSFSYGAPAYATVMGAHLENQPEKVERILNIVEAIITDEEFAVGIKLGEKGTHWQYKDEKADTIEFVGNFADSRQLYNQCLHTDFDTPKYFCISSPSFELVEKYTSRDKREFLNNYSSVEHALNDAFFKPDVVPSAAEYYVNIRTKQMALMTKVILGEKSVDDYKKEFAKIWETYGGKELEKEAKSLNSTLKNIYKQVGVDK